MVSHALLMRFFLLLTRIAAALVVLCLAPHPASAQYAQLHLGLSGNWGFADAYQPGVGGTAGILMGRIFYLGGRYVHYWGSATQTTGQPITDEVQTLAGELAIQIPAGPFELLGSVGIGAAFHRRSTNAALNTREEDHKFMIVPGVTATLPVLGLLVSAEAFYVVTGPPDFDRDGDWKSVGVGLRVVVPLDINFYPIVLERRPK